MAIADLGVPEPTMIIFCTWPAMAAPEKVRRLKVRFVTRKGSGCAKR